MKPLAVLPLSVFLLATPAIAADLDSPIYSDREYIERPLPPRVVERERIIEHHHHHYAPVPIYREGQVYVEPEVYYRTRREYAYYDNYRYAHAGWRKPRHFFPRHHHHWRHHRHGW